MPKMTWLFILLIVGCGSGNPSYTIAPDPVLPPVTTTVKFCVGQTTSYPTSFPEYGLCLDNIIYGVFWDGHNAWWAQIPKGNYISTSTGLQCNFKVLDNCVIQ